MARSSTISEILTQLKRPCARNDPGTHQHPERSRVAHRLACAGWRKTERSDAGGDEPPVLGLRPASGDAQAHRGIPRGQRRRARQARTRRAASAKPSSSRARSRLPAGPRSPPATVAGTLSEVAAAFLTGGTVVRHYFHGGCQRDRLAAAKKNPMALGTGQGRMG